MKKISSILISILLVGIVLLSIVGCGTDTQNELQDKIDQMQAQIDDLKDQIKNRDERIEQLEEELREALSKGEVTVGAFYTIQEAYDNGWLTKEDIMSIAYYHSGRYKNEEIMPEDYTPQPLTPEVLSEATELSIKKTAAKECIQEHHVAYAEADGFHITQYYGTYGDCVAVMMRDDYSGTADIVWIDSIAGVTMYYINGRTIQIWREIK